MCKPVRILKGWILALLTSCHIQVGVLVVFSLVGKSSDSLAHGSCFSKETSDAGVNCTAVLVRESNTMKQGCTGCLKTRYLSVDFPSKEYWIDHLRGLKGLRVSWKFLRQHYMTPITRVFLHSKSWDSQLAKTANWAVQKGMLGESFFLSWDDMPITIL